MDFFYFIGEYGVLEVEKWINFTFDLFLEYTALHNCCDFLMQFIPNSIFVAVKFLNQVFPKAKGVLISKKTKDNFAP